MFLRPLACFLVIISFSCSAQHGEVDATIDKAKWYFYSFACPLKVYAKNHSIVNPTGCEIKINAVKRISKDTTKAYFTFFYKDSMNLCWSTPYDIAGITIIRNELFLPIYTHVIFDDFKNDNSAKDFMKKHEKLLHSNINRNKVTLSRWLKAYTSKTNNKYYRLRTAPNSVFIKLWPDVKHSAINRYFAFVVN